MLRRFLPIALLAAATAAAAPEYRSPYTVVFDYAERDLIGDIVAGRRGDPAEQSEAPYREWYNPANQRRWGYWGPRAKHYPAAPGIASKEPEWQRQRVIATALRFVGYSYQHHHIPDWDPPADWPRPDKESIQPGKGLDCSNFTAFVYNLALGIKPTGAVADQAALTVVPGPGPNRTSRVERIELPADPARVPEVLKTADLLFVKNRSGEISHVVLWVGAIGRCPENLPLVLDSTGAASRDANRANIPSGIYLRPFRPGWWYVASASHALRLILP